MAKLKRGVIKPSGKLGDEVYVNSKYGDYIRKAPKPGIKKDEPALKYQYKRTALLNKLASGINTVIQEHAAHFKSSNFYQRLQSCLRNEPENNRFFLLQQLKGVEINTKYTLAKLHTSSITALSKAKTLELTVHISRHPQYSKRSFNCYDYELLLLTWNKKGNAPWVQKQLSPWIPINEPVPEIDFSFVKPADAMQWILFLRLQLGVNEEPLGFMETEGMQLVEVGSFDKKELKLWEERQNTAKATVANTLKEKKQELRMGVVKRE